jgi:hypothetical protein
MRIIRDIFIALFFVACFFLAIFSACYPITGIPGTLLGCTGMIIVAIYEASSLIVEAIIDPQIAESRARQKQEKLLRKNMALLKKAAAKEEREMVAEIKLDQMMNPVIPDPPCAAKLPKPKAEDFDAIIADEIGKTHLKTR